MTVVPRWTPVALSANLAAGSVTSVRVDGADLVVWRGLDGTLHAWPDWCPHRGMRLSLGHVRGNQLGCGYHGWRFDADGRCTFVPAQPATATPPALRIDQLRCAETAGMIWVADAATDHNSRPTAAPAAGVRSVYVLAGTDSVRQGLGSLTGGDCERLHWWPAGSVAALTVDGYGFTLGLHRLDADTSAVHISCDPDTPISIRVAIAEGAAALRSRLEAHR